jgi:hypothetical protein
MLPHYLFADRFGRSGKGNDKGKVERMVAPIRQNYLAPLQHAASFAALNEHLLPDCPAGVSAIAERPGCDGRRGIRRASTNCLARRSTRATSMRPGLAAVPGRRAAGETGIEVQALVHSRGRFTTKIHLRRDAIGLSHCCCAERRPGA